MLYGHGSVNEYEVVRSVLDIGRYARESGAKKIFISDILVRWGRKYDNIIIRVNNLLRRMCLEENFMYIDQSDITLDHISFDGIHPNFYGRNVLKMNIMLCFNSFNPYFTDFGYDYERSIS